MRRRLLGGGGGGDDIVRSSPYPIRTCHFCTLPSTIVPPHPTSGGSKNDDDEAQPSPLNSVRRQASTAPLSTGSVSNWYCSQCHCWNRVDAREEGGMASWEQSMAVTEEDNKRNAVHVRQPSTSYPSTSKMMNVLQNGNGSAFCHACQTNQMLLLSMSANYDGDDDVDDPQQQQRYRNWREELEARYPPVCADCQETVDGRIRLADQRARALIWNDLLRKRQQERIAQQHSSPARDTAGPIATSPVASMQSTRTTPLPYSEQAIATYYSIAWCAGAACFTLSWLAEVLLVGSVAVSPADRRSNLFALALALLHCGSLQWDPSVVQQVAIAEQQQEARTQRVRVTGMKQWRSSLFTLAGSRLLHVVVRWGVAAALSQSLRTTGALLSLGFIAVEAYLCMRAYSHIHVESPTRISLKSRSSVASPSRRRQNELDLTNLTLDQDKKHAFDTVEPRTVYEDEVNDNDSIDSAAAEDSMDWSPTLPANDRTWSTPASSSFQLGPQRFFEPVKQTGLEELLASRLDLSHDRTKPPSELSHNDTMMPSSNTARPIGRAVFAVIIALVALTAVFVTVVASSSPTSPIALSTASRTLRDWITSPWRTWWQRALLLIAREPLDGGGGVWHAHAAARRPEQPILY